MRRLITLPARELCAAGSARRLNGRRGKRVRGLRPVVLLSSPSPVLTWQGEKLLSKLGGMFSLGYKPKKGKAVTGPKDYGGEDV